jgi:hypothetical protein
MGLLAGVGRGVMTHYNIFSSPLFAAVTLAFLE